MNVYISSLNRNDQDTDLAATKHSINHTVPLLGSEKITMLSYLLSDVLSASDRRLNTRQQLWMATSATT